MLSNVEIHPIEQADLYTKSNELTEFYATHIFAEPNLPDWVFGTVTRTIERNQTVVALQHNALVGAATYQLHAYSPRRRGKHTVLEYIATSPQVRNCGLAKSLLDVVIRDTIESGASQLVATTEKHGQARGFYAKIGFTIDERAYPVGTSWQLTID